MAVAKRQGREKPKKVGHWNVRGPEWGPQVEQTALLASPIYIRLAPQRAGDLLFFSSRLLGRHTLVPRGCIFLYFLNKTELSHEAVTLVCLRAVTLAQWRAITLICHLKFLLWWDRTKELHSPLTVAMLDCCRVNWHAFINLFNSHLFRFFFFWPL